MAIVGVSVTYNFKTGNNKIKLLTENKSEPPPPPIRFILSENFLRCIFLGAGLGITDQICDLRANPLDFFLWGYVKDIVYKIPVTSPPPR
jgi:hypothetical protein